MGGYLFLNHDRTVKPIEPNRKIVWYYMATFIPDKMIGLKDSSLEKPWAIFSIPMNILVKHKFTDFSLNFVENFKQQSIYRVLEKV